MTLLLLLAVLGCKNDSDLNTVDAYNTPSLSFDGPGPAGWLAAGDNTLSGTAHYLNNITVNDTSASLDGAAWSANYSLPRGISTLMISGADERGDQRGLQASVIAGEFGDPIGLVDDAIILRVNEPGLNSMLDTVGGMLEADTISASLMALNPIYTDAYGVFGWDAVTVNADIGGLWFDRPVLTAEAFPNVLALSVDLPNLEVQVPVYGEAVGFHYDVDVWVWATDAVVDADVVVDVVGGELMIDVLSATTTLYGFGYDTSLLPGSVEDYILVDTIRSTLEDKITEQITEQVPKLMAEQLGGLDLSFDTELLGTQLSISAGFSSAIIDKDGLELATNIDVKVPGTGDVTYAGTLLAPAGTPTLSRQDDVAMAISDDMLNRVLFEVWRGGLLDLTLSTEDGSLDPLMLLPIGGTSGTISVHAGLPPVFVQLEGSSGAVAQLGELKVVLDVPGSSLGDHIELDLGLSTDIDLVVTDGELSLDMVEPSLKIWVEKTSEVGVSNEALSAVLAEALPIGSLLAIADLKFPLPQVAGIGVGSGAAERDADRVHTVVGLGLAR